MGMMCKHNVLAFWGWSFLIGLMMCLPFELGMEKGHDASKYAPEDYKEIDFVEFVNLLHARAKLAVIDTREKQDFDSGHVPNAINVPYSGKRVEDSQWEDIRKILDDAAVIVVYGSYWDSNCISMTDFLYEKGYESTHLYRHGWEEWERINNLIKGSEK